MGLIFILVFMIVVADACHNITVRLDCHLKIEQACETIRQEYKGKASPAP